MKCFDFEITLNFDQFIKTDYFYWILLKILNHERYFMYLDFTLKWTLITINLISLNLFIQIILCNLLIFTRIFQFLTNSLNSIYYGSYSKTTLIFLHRLQSLIHCFFNDSCNGAFYNINTRSTP